MVFAGPAIEGSGARIEDSFAERSDLRLYIAAGRTFLVTHAPDAVLISESF